MPIPEDYLYILTSYRGYLAPIRQFGPIVHPAKVKKSEATALMMAGCPVTVYDPETKKSYPLTFENATKSVKEALHEIQKPIETTVLNGAPMGAGDLGITERDKPVEPKMKVDLAATIKKQEEEKSVEEAKVEEVKVEEPPVAEILQMDTNINTDTPDAVESVTTTTKTPLDELLKNNELTEDQVIWSDYTKAERRQIRAHLNALTAEATENA